MTEESLTRVTVIAEDLETHEIKIYEHREVRDFRIDYWRGSTYADSLKFKYHGEAMSDSSGEYLTITDSYHDVIPGVY